jgi:sulfite reductase (NADPH) flavoprotein alpha-component
MIGPGTGIAPFRAFMQERIARGARGHHWLFFGERSRKEFLYGNYWQKLQHSGKLHLSCAFSRAQPHKVYVQHKMIEEGAALFSWVEAGAHLYVCGDATQMAKDVDAALCQIVSTHGGYEEAEARAYVKALRKEGRYQRDVY